MNIKDMLFLIKVSDSTTFLEDFSKFIYKLVTH